MGKPVLFTELGYRSTTRPAARPWEWPERSKSGWNGATATDLEGQARCYQAFFRTFWHEPWFAGVYVWKWYPATARLREAANRGFTPQGKPAEQVLRHWFGVASAGR